MLTTFTLNQPLRMSPLTLRSHRHFFMRLIGAAFAALALAVSGHAADWWNPEWSVRRKITLDVPAGADAPGGATVLLRLHDGNFAFAAAKEDGSDLRLVAEDDKTALAFHIEKYDGSLLNEAFVWVRVPALKASAKTTLWLYYGNQKAPPAGDAKATFDADTVLVWHANSDVTGNGNNPATALAPIDGALIGQGLRLDGKTAVTIPAAPSLAWSAAAPITLSVWVKPAATAPNATLFSRRDGQNVFRVGLDNGAPFIEVNNQRAAARAPLAPVAWHHLAAVADGAKVTLYADGEVVATLASTLPALNTPAALGADTGPGGAGFAGEVDELEIARVARPAGLVALAVANQGAGEAAGKFVTVGDEEHSHGVLDFLKGGYIGVIIGSLTVDGWVVIGLLAVMGVISWLVMIGKALYLKKISKGNALFMEQWRHVVADLSVLDGDETSAKSLGGRLDAVALKAMRDSSLFRVYHIGVAEIRHRLVADKSERTLSARSIQAIRASLDGGVVRESQRLNSQIVLLTIAISGGPFLGLLGTVVGVMITFAAVAAAGDVNVNAIAPGIAAALAATVAGLAVAIPSLFGYNWLLTQIKEATADMHVFIDEFVTRMAEFYSEPGTRPNFTRAPFAPSEPRK
jgi:biopolymer transport protein ExbB